MVAIPIIALIQKSEGLFCYIVHNLLNGLLLHHIIRSYIKIKRVSMFRVCHFRSVVWPADNIFLNIRRVCGTLKNNNKRFSWWLPIAVGI